ncbi:MAG: hypothetical protein AD742_14360 [Methylibium sp. NZG]|nr:MAG: hypothetical protein AD742_14360 [Methylibium sp. NZG]
MMRSMVVCALACSTWALAACGEKPQEAATRKSDTQAWQASSDTHRAAGWKDGDRSSWEAQMRVRASGQDEYAKVK